MPWSIEDVDKHKEGLSKAKKKKWVEIANSILKECRETKKSSSECEAKAIRVANSKVSSGDE